MPKIITTGSNAGCADCSRLRAEVERLKKELDGVKSALIEAQRACHRHAEETREAQCGADRQCLRAVEAEARAERLAVMCRPMVEAARDHADHLGVTEAWEAQIQAAEAALAEQPAQESKPAEPRRYYYETVYGNRKTFTADSDEAAKKRVEGVSSLLVLYRESDTPDGTPFIRLIDRYSKPAEPAGGK